MPAAQRVGIVGGGQLGRMLALAAATLDLRVTVLDPATDACAATAADLIVAPYDDAAALAQLAERSDVVTFEFENVPGDALRTLADAHRVAPPPRALEVSQDRLLEKQLFAKLGIATAPYAPADDAESLASALAELGVAAVVKTRRLGYDGKGQAHASGADDAAQVFSMIGARPAIAEQLVAFDRELSQVSVRGQGGALAHYPLVENRHADGILRETHAPAAGAGDALAARAREYVTALLEELDYVGVIALELFQVGDDLLANEFAPRVHNTGHWTIDAAVCSQFENHLRAVCGLPLGGGDALGPCTMFNLIGGLPELGELAAVPGARIHLYGKAPRPGRKLGHVTLLHDAASDPEDRARRLRELVAGVSR